MSDVSTLLTFRHFPAPAHGPRRDYSYMTEEPSITRVSRALGKEPQPWQRHVWAIGTEYRWSQNANGQRVKNYHYTDVLISTPRQSGKTTLLRPLRVYRMITNPSVHLFSTAQSQKHAAKRMLDMVSEVEFSLIGPLFKPRRGKGDAGLDLLANHSTIAQFTPNEEAAHGETSPYVDWDEIWAFTEEEGNAVLGGLRPSQITLHGQAQRWLTSTRGTYQSTFMNGMIDASLKGDKPRMAFISWELPEGADPYDPAEWWRFHPALGNTITEDALRDELDMPEGEWLRAYCNRLTDSVETFMPMEDWDELAESFESLDPPALADVTIGFEVGRAAENAAVVAAWHLDDERPVVRLIHQAPGTAWLPDYLRGLKADGAARFAADSKGPTRRIVDALGADVPVEELGYDARLIGDSAFIIASRDDGTLIHDGSKALKVQIANAYLRRVNGVEMFDRDRSGIPIPAVIAASVALHLDCHRPMHHLPVLVS